MAYTTINKSSDYFNTVLYTGTGTSPPSQSITGVGFQPDLVWTKQRNGTNQHALVDAVRGVTKRLFSSSTSAESINTDSLSAFNSDGFTVGSAGTSGENNATYAAWNWLANGAGSANTDGSISSTVSANTTSGFSIVSWTSLASGSNYTVGHGLGSTPAMIIMKGRHELKEWMVYHHKNTSAPETEYLSLNTTGATIDYILWNDTAPTSSVFTCGTWSGFNAGGTMIAYCFAEKQGYSKFGSYTGNGSTDGTFVYTGFKPAWLMIKRTDDANSWIIMDNKRTTFNPMGEELKAEVSDAGNVATRWDQLSNGFKLRNAGAAVNASGGTYIYMAFAEAPLVGTNNVPGTAR